MAERPQSSASDVQLTQLRAFDAVARLGSYARAAEYLSYSEPAIFLQMRALERVLGVPLVRRRKKQVLLTSQGEELLPLASAMLDAATRLEQAARALRGRIIVAAGSNTAMAWLFPLIARYEAENPGQSIELHVIHSRELDAGIMEGLYDMAFGGLGYERPPVKERRSHHVVAVPWVRDEWVVFGPKDPQVLIDRYRSVKGAALRVYYYGPWTRIPKEKILAELQSRLRVQIELVPVPTLELTKGAVINGFGLGLLPRSASRTADASQLRILDGPACGPLTISIVHRRARDMAPPVRQFLTFVLQEGRRIRRERLTATAIADVAAADQDGMVPSLS